MLTLHFYGRTQVQLFSGKEESPQRWQTFCICLDSQQWVRRIKISLGSRTPGEATHIMGDTLCAYTCSFVRMSLMQWSVPYSLKHEFIKRKLAPKSKIQYIKLHQADQRETESRFNIAFSHHSSNPSTIIYPKACRAAKLMSKTLFPWWIFQGHS